jgi:acyl dehydratase
MPRLYFEDFKVGDTIDLGERVVDRDEVIAFATAFDPQPFHVDEDAARATSFGGLIASGWHTAAMVMRMMCDTYMLESASLGSPGMDSVRWLRPVRPGDTIRATSTVLAARVSQSKPGVGIVTSRFDVRNQHGELVMTMEGPGMFSVRNPAGGGMA